MNIDLLRSKAGDFGLICDETFPSIPRVILFDREKGTLSLEFEAQHEALVCNVPVVEEWRTPMLLIDNIVVGCIVAGVVQTAEMIPLRAF